MNARQTHVRMGQLALMGSTNSVALVRRDGQDPAVNKILDTVNQILA